MKYLTMTFLLLSLSLYAEDKEGDLQMPVSDISEIERQEELPPTLEEVEMEQEEVSDSKKTESKTRDTSKGKHQTTF